MAGQNVDLCIYDIERLFSPDREQASRKKDAKGNKRGWAKEANQLQDGEVWRAKNVSRDSVHLLICADSVSDTHVLTCSSPTPPNSTSKSPSTTAA